MNTPLDLKPKASAPKAIALCPLEKKSLALITLTALKRHSSALLIIVVVVFVVNLLYQGQAETMSPQSVANLEFSANPSLVSALDTYPTYWAPFYPSVLWFSVKLGIPVRKFNQLCFYFILFLIGYFANCYINNIHWSYIIVFVTLLNTNYINVYQQVSEPLFVLIAFIILLMVLQYRHSPTICKLCWLGVLVSMSCLTRFFGFFWTLPLCLAFVWWNNNHNAFQVKLLHTGVFCGIVGLLVSPWLLRLRWLTGSFSGMDRFGSRGFSRGYGQLLTVHDTAFTNFKSAIKTIIVDFLSPHRYANHRVINNSPLSMLETCMSIIFALLAIIMFIVICHVLYHSLRSHIEDWLVNFPLADEIVPLHFSLLYFISIIALWTLTNNDAIYTRFMYPMYPFAVLAIFSLYSSVVKEDSGIYKKLPFILLYWLVLGVNCYKNFNDVFR